MTTEGVLYRYRLDTNTYTRGPALANGTYKRFGYFPALGVFALVNDWQSNAYVLRLTPL